MAGHGGAWKVAFADFMTAMMALFLVLWISAQDKKILIATSRYFQSPFSSPMEDHSGIMPFNKQNDSNNSPKEKDDSDGAAKANSKDKQVELSFLNSVAADFYRLLHLDQNLDQKPIDIQVTSDGLRVTLFDRAKQPLFKEDGVEFTEFGTHLIQSMAWLIDRHRFRVTIDGHTREGLKLPREDYTAWELSSDRANAARRKLVYYAVEPELIERVTGYAATRPLPNEAPTSEANQRITLSLALAGKDKDKDKAKAKLAAAGGSAGSIGGTGSGGSVAGAEVTARKAGDTPHRASLGSAVPTLPPKAATQSKPAAPAKSAAAPSDASSHP